MSVNMCVTPQKDRNKYVFLHIGKCAGSSVYHKLIQWSSINNLELEYSHLAHVTSIDSWDVKKFIIVLRNPIERFISAFYWRYMGTVDTDKQRFRFKGEYEILKECKTVENYVQKIKKEGVKYRDGFQSGYHIQHLPQDINWYLRPLISSNKSDSIYKVVVQENIIEDMKTHFNLNMNIKTHENKNEKYDRTLSKESQDFLKEILVKDYECIETLYKWNKITDKQYKLLINEA